MASKPEVRRSPVAALLFGAPIGLLGGLIGLGGAEFRLPVLAGVFGYPARRAVALNIAISLITVVSALLIRGSTLSLAPLLGLLPVVLAMILSAVSAAYVGTALVHRVSERLLERVILVFLVVIGTALILESFLPRDVPGLLPDAPLVRVVAAVAFGLAVGRRWHQDGGHGEPLDLAADRGGRGATPPRARLLRGPRGSHPNGRPDGDRVGDRRRSGRLPRRAGPCGGAQARAGRDPDRVGRSDLSKLLAPLTDQHILVHTPIEEN